MRRLCFLPLLLATTFAMPALAQTADAEHSAIKDMAGLPETLPREWIVRYELGYGADGLYVAEPPPAPGDLAANVRADLVTLTKAARRMALLEPEAELTTETLLSRKYLKEPIVAPPGITYTWKPEAKAFASNRGRDFQLVGGAARQVEFAQLYARRVAEGSPLITQHWKELWSDPATPETIKREIETRRFAMVFLESPLVHNATEAQIHLQKLDDAIQLAVASGMLDAATSITMQDVGRTGLIDTLFALPAGGRYVVESTDRRPYAMFGNVRVDLSPDALREQLRIEAAKVLAQRPNYPPAMALLARYTKISEASELLDRAIALWPDVPALRIQRLAVRASRMRVTELPEDLDYLLARFPATPILLEVESATRHGALRRDTRFRAGVAQSLADLREDVLPLQLLAIEAHLENGDTQAVSRIVDRMSRTHPGYAYLFAGA